jgi:chromosome segregation ATPase
MADDRLIRRLEEQLRDAHATNADLRERLQEKRKIEAQAAYDVSKVGQLENQVERFSVKLKAAEQNAYASDRKLKKAESEVRYLEEQLSTVSAERDRAKAEAYELNELNARVESAKSIRDLVS